jgi:hypothetical protein
MNADTGQVYDLGEDFTGFMSIGDKLSKELLDEKMGQMERALSSDEMAAAVEAARGDTIVRVSAEAAQRSRLGDRELRRRRQRRR